MGSSRWWYLFPESVRTFPADLAVVVGLTVLMIPVATVPVISETPLRIVLGLPFVLFLPGYAFVAALFPEASPSSDRAAEPAAESSTSRDEAVSHVDRQDGIDGIERLALSFGLSIAITPLIGLVLNFTPWGIRLVPILISVGGITVLGCIVAAQRRWDLPPEERFRVPYRDWYRSVRSEFLAPASRTDAILNGVLVLSVFFAVASVGYAVSAPSQGESFTEFYLLTEGTDGNLVADNYPTEFTTRDTRSIIVGVGNQERELTRYTVVVMLQNVSVSDNSTSLETEQELGRLETELQHNETWTRQYEIEPTVTGTRLRLAFLLYRGSTPGEPTIENAYRETHLWINVTAN